jgi:hypothetical protein
MKMPRRTEEKTATSIRSHMQYTHCVYFNTQHEGERLERQNKPPLRCISVHTGYA